MTKVTGLPEQPCIQLMLTRGKPDITTIPATRGTRATAECLTTSAQDCPKSREKLCITPHCFRIRTKKYNQGIKD